ncbi:hypothetical protein A2996_00155 [Candidatus Campbellbacteria bacterium RIFCSPLOWO2_01_FULL_34_15]|uniref:Uncharacterized protein n=2 Tax=Candidatus Campbelliibacteriota TaxID=1752727 RepID=A0A1F5ENU3_9BACT|nr:MAG: hypothetical protein A2996_00155 [Candidatus Campbellbacteria bacterium RIFCSPLOWO2_01_FULL_34_15]OGD69102.1 MAG: hypothetical protein A2811_02265 [Candidatus Campbellbacteria bacterium RIFCSPHIGHO2_01_FULL_34_10]
MEIKNASIISGKIYLTEEFDSFRKKIQDRHEGYDFICVLSEDKKIVRFFLKKSGLSSWKEINPNDVITFSEKTVEYRMMLFSSWHFYKASIQQQ